MPKAIDTLESEEIDLSRFNQVSWPNCHVTRRKEILSKYPQIQTLNGYYPLSAVYISLIVLTQLSIAYFFSLTYFDHWWLLLLVAYALGAFFNHAMYVMIHECTHNNVLRTSFQNKIMGIICDLPLVLPSALGFRKYHMIHHKHLGEYHYDPDITSVREGLIVGNSPFTKMLWLFFFSLSQALRPLKVKFYKPLDRWTAINTIIIVTVNILILKFWGVSSLIYLSLSTLFALGLHPLGGRWIQEHYLTKIDQETYSYYGVLNKLTFNMGYHNEHHDFMNVPWVYLPKIKKTAPEYYDHLVSYKSWTKVLLNFIFNPRLDSFSRMIHPDNHPNRSIEHYKE
jgi:sphingolipid 4-desaturase/C4-monooxygenase